MDIFPKKTYRWPTGIIKTCSILLIMRETQVKTNEISPYTYQNGYHQNDNKQHDGEDAEKREHSGTAGRLPRWLHDKESAWQCRKYKKRSLGQEDPLEDEMATHSSILAWKSPWTEKPGRLQSMRSQRVEHDLATKQQRYRPPG